jgi:hypothetical protein
MNVDMAVLTARQNKPKMGEPCNNCGWCCLTAVCPVGKELGGGREPPCKLLTTEGDKHLCDLAGCPPLAKVIDIGGGCDAISTAEKLAELMGQTG